VATVKLQSSPDRGSRCDPSGRPAASRWIRCNPLPIEDPVATIVTMRTMMEYVQLQSSSDRGARRGSTSGTITPPVCTLQSSTDRVSRCDLGKRDVLLQPTHSAILYR